MKLWINLIPTLLLAACASYSGSGLAPGVAQLADVQAHMGQPAMRWEDADGSVQLAYARGPAGLDTYMVRLGPDGLSLLRHGVSPERTVEALAASDPDSRESGELRTFLSRRARSTALRAGFVETSGCGR